MLNLYNKIIEQLQSLKEEAEYKLSISDIDQDDIYDVFRDDLIALEFAIDTIKFVRNSLVFLTNESELF